LLLFYWFKINRVAKEATPTTTGNFKNDHSQLNKRPTIDKKTLTANNVANIFCKSFMLLNHQFERRKGEIKAFPFLLLDGKNE